MRPLPDGRDRPAIVGKMGPGRNCDATLRRVCLISSKTFSEGHRTWIARWRKNWLLKSLPILGSKAKSSPGVVIGEPVCPYKIAVHTRNFWCGVFVSDVAYVFQVNHKAPTSEICGCVDFSVGLDRKSSGRQKRRKSLPKVSDILGVEVYTAAGNSEDFILKAVAEGPVLQKFKAIDFYPVVEFHACPIQLRVTSSLQSAAHCAAQTRLFQELILVLFAEARKRQKSNC